MPEKILRTTDEGWYLIDGHFLKKDGSVVKQGSIEWFEMQELLGVSETSKEDLKALKDLRKKSVDLKDLKVKETVGAGSKQSKTKDTKKDDTEKKGDADGGDE